jgi:hypothetical protein
MVVLSRAVGVPCRMVNGFSGGEWNRMGQFTVVRQSDAHSWVEVYFGRELGWVAFDPTPPVSRMRSYGAGVLAFLREAVDFMHVQWLARVVRYDLSDQRRLWERARNRAESLGELIRRRASLRFRGPEDVERRLALPLGILLVAGGVVAMIASSGIHISFDWLPIPVRHKRGGPAAVVYGEALLAMGRRGTIRPDGQTPFEFVSEVARGDPHAAASLRRITEVFCRERYGELAATAPELAEIRKALDTLRAAPAKHAKR